MRKLPFLVNSFFMINVLHPLSASKAFSTMMKIEMCVGLRQNFQRSLANSVSFGHSKASLCISESQYFLTEPPNCYHFYLDLVLPASPKG